MFLIRNGRMIDPRSGTDAVADLIIDGDHISHIGKAPEDVEYEEIIEADGKIVAPGLIDVHVHFRDPGFLDKEDILTGAKAAAAGGFTTVVCMANTKPLVDTVETLDYVMEKSAKAVIRVLNTAAVTKGFAGVELTDMAALKAYGAVGFTDDGVPIADSRVVRDAMLVAKELNLPLSFHEEDPGLIGSPGINAGAVARQLGVEGASNLSEHTLIARDCVLTLDTGATVNIQHVSSAESVELIRFAKGRGARIHAEVTPQHFSLTQEAALTVGTLAKVNPPLRTEQDRMALIRGLQDGVIDIIATDHAPHTAAEKAKPLAEAPSGMIGLETALGLGITHLVRPGYLSLSQLLEKMTVNPAKLYNLDAGHLAEGTKADLTIFDEAEQWQVDPAFVSRSSNSPFIGHTLYGRVKYTICGGKIVYTDQGKEE